MSTQKSRQELVNTCDSIDTPNISTRLTEIGQKNLKQKQEENEMSIENNNIQNHVFNELLTNFKPPFCVNCPNRKADRVCMNKECGKAKFMQIICGKCHSDVHSKATGKSEIDIDDFFIQLSTFMSEHKYFKQNHSDSINVEHLNFTFSDLNRIREQLSLLKSQIRCEVEGYQSPLEMHSLLQENITKSLSLCEYDNIQLQLQQIKKRVLFSKNEFLWNDATQKYRQYMNSIKQLEESNKTTRKTISQSFIGNKQIMFDDLQMVFCNRVSLFNKQTRTFENIKPIEGVFHITSERTSQLQYYLDYKLNWDKKYKLRMRFTKNPKDYVMIGIMPLTQANSNWVFNFPNEFFCKRFFNCTPEQGCSRIIKGNNLSHFPINETIIEMRIDLEGDYVDFADYPDCNHINANFTNYKLERNEPYVIGIAVHQDQTVLIEYFEETYSFQTY